MNEKNYLNYHVLISHSPSCLNRDDMNMQKSAIFGGVRRVRISSQCLKRAMRKSQYYQDHLGKPSDRTRELQKLKDIYVRQLSSEFLESEVSDIIDRIAGAGKYREKKKGAEQEDQEDENSQDEKKQAVAPWSVEEVKEILKTSRPAKEQYKGEPKKSQKEIKKIIENSVQNIRKALSNSVDIALSGRMATSGIMTSVDGALAVAHAITTHSVDADMDWFSAVDDLVESEGGLGSGHLNTQEFSSGVFYRYVSLNIRQLQENIGDASREDALKIARHVLHMLATVVPSAKQQSFAANNMADFVLVSFSDMPLSLANAFEKPVEQARSGGFIEPSITALLDYWQRIYQGYGLKDRTAAFSVWDLKTLTSKPSLSELGKWVEEDGPAGG